MDIYNTNTYRRYIEIAREIDTLTAIMEPVRDWNRDRQEEIRELRAAAVDEFEDAKRDFNLLAALASRRLEKRVAPAWAALSVSRRTN